MSPSDITLIERLRNENLEQYFTLVRMHLSFVVDINTDDVDCSTDKPKQFRWNFHKKNKCSASSSSQNNTNNVKYSTEIKSITEDGIARLNELIDFLSKPENVQQEGIFRRTGSLSRQQDLKQLLLTGSDLGLDAGKFSVHDCASVLKGFLAELPQPLLMDQYYQTYCTLAAQYPPNAETSQTKLLTALQLLLLLLTPTHRSFLQRLLRLLRLVADNEVTNRMSPDTLATMFTPHLLCPRKLSPENFHADAIALSPLISFMIRESCRVFEAPRRLATDAAAYFTLRRRRAMSPDINLDDSISDKTAANTVYTFVDRNRTKAENETNPTDTALAQLYAHIQALPDSHQKRRLIKHFNRQNGYGTPIQIQRTGKVAGSRSFGDSIKRHIFNKGLLNKTPKKCTGSSISSINTIEEKTKGKRYADEKVDVSHKNIVLKNLANKIASSESLDDDYQSDASNESTLSDGAITKSKKLSPKFVSEPNLSVLDTEETPKNAKKRLFRSKIVTSQNKKYQKRNGVLRNTPTCVSCFEDQESGSDLSVNDTPKKSRLCDDEIKHYLTSTPGVGEIFDGECSTPYTINFRRASMSPITKSTQKLSKAMQESIMTPRSRKPLIITSEQRDSMPDTNENKPSDKSDEIFRSIESDISPKNDSDFVSSDDEMSRSSFSCERSRSTQSISGSQLRIKNQYDVRSMSLGDISPLRCDNTRFISRNRSNRIDTISTTLSDDGIVFKASHELKDHTKSLTDPFREYLLSRSVLTATPIDLSILNKSNDDRAISDSLMYCLDGNIPSDLTLSISNLAVDNRLPMMDIDFNIDKSPKRQRCDSDTSVSEKSAKKMSVDKENKVYAFRETEL